MLISFAVKNFRSFRDETEFNMLVGNYKRHENHISEKNSGLKLLKGGALYGANGSGKSNMVEALRFLKELVVKGTKDLNAQIHLPVFKLDPACKKEPSQFQVELYKSGSRYIYGIRLAENRILAEWLYQVSGQNKRDVIFERQWQNDRNKLQLGTKGPMTEKERLRQEIYEEELRGNQPFIYEGVNKNMAALQPVYAWFRDDLQFIRPGGNPTSLTYLLATHYGMADKVNKFIRAAHVGIDEVASVKTSPELFFSNGMGYRKEEIIEEVGRSGRMDFKDEEGNAYSAYQNEEKELEIATILAKHHDVQGKLIDFHLNEESDGTKRLLELLPAIIGATEMGKVYVVDEIENSFHPVLLKEILHLFLSTPTNGSAGQLIFTTHETNLLDLELFRQDEIWFVEKDETGNSKLYSLSDFKPRYDKDIRKGYLEGQFSFEPFLVDIKGLQWG